MHEAYLALVKYYVHNVTISKPLFFCPFLPPNVTKNNYSYFSLRRGIYQGGAFSKVSWFDFYF